MKNKSCLSTLKRGGIIAASLLVIVLTAIILHNQTLPTASSQPAQLSTAEKGRLAEITHLRTTLGSEIWPGWGEMQIPIVIYKESYAFLVGLSSPADGWVRVPHEQVEAAAWQAIPNEEYFRQPLPASGETPQAFIVQIGETFAASMTTKDWTGIHLVEMMKAELPAFISPFVPYALVVRQFNSDWFIAAVLHESFHALQAQQSFQRVADAESATVLEKDYPWDDNEFRDAWSTERQLLAKAIQQTEDEVQLRALVAEWLSVRVARRKELSDDLISYEQKREWLEGLAKYAELQSWLLAGATEEYSSLPVMADLPDFDAYQKAEAHWKQELNQLKSDLQFDDTVFYYSGWAQAELLDRLMPDWKSIAFEPGVYLDTLLADSLVK